jgi:ribose/xylose/arabinose/galactoside ABC-type transport system permease subunit
VKLLALAALIVTFALLSDRFATVANGTNILRQISAVVIVGAPVTLLMVSRGFDLSVGGVVALSGIVAASLASQIPLPLAFIVGSSMGLLIGVVNGILTVKIGVNPVIATLGTLYVARGGGLLFTGGSNIDRVPPGYNFLGGGYVGPVPVPVLVMTIVVLVFVVLERKTLLGRFAVAVGSNPGAAYLSGVPVALTQFALFALSGLMAGLAGVMLSSRLSAGVPTLGIGFEFDVIVATILGGTSLAGGEGTVLGMVLGAVIVGVLNNGLNLLGVQSFWQVVTQGIVLVIAVAIDTQVRTRRLSRSRHAQAAGPRD